MAAGAVSAGVVRVRSEALRAGLAAELGPTGTLADCLVERLAATLWKLARCDRLETSLHGLAPPPAPGCLDPEPGLPAALTRLSELALLERREGRLERVLLRLLRELRAPGGRRPGGRRPEGTGEPAAGPAPAPAAELGPNTETGDTRAGPGAEPAVAPVRPAEAATPAPSEPALDPLTMPAEALAAAPSEPWPLCPGWHGRPRDPWTGALLPLPEKDETRPNEPEPTPPASFPASSSSSSASEPRTQPSSMAGSGPAMTRRRRHPRSPFCHPRRRAGDPSDPARH